MKKNILFTIFLLSILCGCNLSNKTTGVNKIDTIDINPQLKKVVSEYIKATPGYKNYIVLDGFILHDEYKRISEEYYIYTIQPALDVYVPHEHYGKERLLPYNYFELDNKIVYISSSCDALVTQKKKKEFYDKNIIIDKEIGHTPWVIAISEYGNVKVLSKNADDMCGVPKVLNSIKYEAPMTVTEQ